MPKYPKIPEHQKKEIQENKNPPDTPPLLFLFIKIRVYTLIMCSKRSMLIAMAPLVFG